MKLETVTEMPFRVSLDDIGGLLNSTLLEKIREKAILQIPIFLKMVLRKELNVGVLAPSVPLDQILDNFNFENLLSFFYEANIFVVRIL